MVISQFQLGPKGQSPTALFASPSPFGRRQNQDDLKPASHERSSLELDLAISSNPKTG